MRVPGGQGKALQMGSGNRCERDPAAELKGEIGKRYLGDTVLWHCDE